MQAGITKSHRFIQPMDREWSIDIVDPVPCTPHLFVKKDHFNPRSTDDLFVMALESTDKTNEAEAMAFLQSLGAQDVKVEYKETGWWLGRYDKDTMRFERKEEIPVH